MKVKNYGKALVAALSLGLFVFGCSGCGPKALSPENEKEEGRMGVNFVLLKSETEKELLAEAKKEGTLTVYTITSRTEAAGKAFEKKYGIKVVSKEVRDYELDIRLAKEMRLQEPTADLVICQDSSRVFGKLLSAGYLENYVPAEAKKEIPEKYQVPLAFAYMNKILVYNDGVNPTAPITNLWELTEPKFKDKFLFKNPVQEGINANFLTMLTKPEVAEMLAKAYEARYNKPLELTTKNAGFEWIKRVMQNGIVLGNSDTRLMGEVGKEGVAPNTIALINYSKLREAKAKNLKVAAAEEVTPFCGFVYPEFMLLVKNAKHPAAARLFMKFLLTEEGFQPWVEGMGVYSTNANIKPSKGDKTLSEWQKIMITGEPQFIYEHRPTVMEFITRNMQ